MPAGHREAAFCSGFPFLSVSCACVVASACRSRAEQACPSAIASARFESATELVGPNGLHEMCVEPSLVSSVAIALLSEPRKSHEPWSTRRQFGPQTFGDRIPIEHRHVDV